MKRFKFLGLGTVAIMLVFLTDCGDSDSPEPVEKTGQIIFNFEHRADGEAIEFDEMKYVNTAGNIYEVSEIQWFISDITLHKSDGGSILLDDTEFAHYVDTDIPQTWEWAKTDTVPAGNYTSVSVTFGLKGEKNIPLTFVNPPESDMIWPYPMGGVNGGYHYMKLNGFWMTSMDERKAFNFHLGVGKIVDDEGAIEFVQNWFEVELDNSAFDLSDNVTKKISIVMNVEEWFNNPNVYDHDVYGGQIMNNQEAMQSGCENGENGVFEIGLIE